MQLCNFLKAATVLKKDSTREMSHYHGVKDANDTL